MEPEITLSQVIGTLLISPAAMVAVLVSAGRMSPRLAFSTATAQGRRGGLYLLLAFVAAAVTFLLNLWWLGAVLVVLIALFAFRRKGLKAAPEAAGDLSAGPTKVPPSSKAQSFHQSRDQVDLPAYMLRTSREPIDTPLSFEYADRNGIVTHRVLSDWTADETYLHGHCEDVDEARTFRLDRILTWFGDSEHRVLAYVRDMQFPSR